jgi:hypothetical protein
MVTICGDIPSCSNDTHGGYLNRNEWVVESYNIGFYSNSRLLVVTIHLSLQLILLNSLNKYEKGYFL